MLTKRNLAILVAALALVFVVAACGGKKEEPKAAAPAPAAKEQPKEAAKEQPKEAATDFPSKEIKMLVTQSAGGGFDTQIRGFVPYFKKNLPGDKAVVVDNMPSGGGMAAMNAAWTAKPDGHTLIYMPVGPMLVEQFVHPDRAKYKISEFEWIGQYVKDVRALAVRADLPYKTWDDLVKASKEKPLVYATAGASSPPAVEGMILANSSDIKFKYVNYPGSADMRAAFARKEAEIAILTFTSFMKWVEDKDAKFICVFADQRHPWIKDVPTAIESGMPKDHFEKFTSNPAVSTPRAIAAPPKTPANVMKILREAFNKAGQDKDFLAWGEKVKEVWLPVAGDKFSETVKKMEENLAKDAKLIETLKGILK